MTDQLLYEVQDDIGLITFNRPEARNALTFEMYERLAEICVAAARIDSSLKALIITGAGDKAFAAGTDISRFREFTTPKHALDYEARMDEVLGAVERVPVPVVAAIRGACTGGGAAIAACCDLRVANADLKFGFPIARTLGNCLSVGNLSRLVSLLGAARTKDIIFTTRLIGIQEALGTGFVCETAEDPLARARELAVQMSGYAPLTLRATKEGLRRLREKTAELDGSDLITQCYTSEDFREGLEAFLAKKKPEWRGR